MSRKDHKGKVLQKGEYQRPDGRYLYAYTNESHKRIYVYADTLAYVTGTVSYDGFEIGGMFLDVTEIKSNPGENEED